MVKTSEFCYFVRNFYVNWRNSLKNGTAFATKLFVM